ncbi:MAG: hypothetical protein J1F60_07360 [Oscillospiraceae bacterium]|nr:hypothetical protein [Oscillospiraceae bacterium]
MQKTLKILPVCAAAVAVIAVIFRVFQLIVVVDYTEMGFFDADAGFFATWGLYLILLIGAVIFIAAAILDKRSGSAAYDRPAASLSPKQTAILGVAFLLGACLRLYNLVFDFKESVLGFVGEALIFVLFTLIGFLILGSRRLKPVVGYLHIVICISCTMNAAALFMQDTIIIRVSDELLLLLSYICSVLFFLALGRFISGIESKLTRFKLLILGGLTAALSLCASLAGYIALIVDAEYIEPHMAMHPISETGTGIIALAVIMILYGRSSLPVEEGPERTEGYEGNELHP